MLTEAERTSFEADCRAICDRAREYEKKPQAEKLQDVWLGLREIVCRLADQAAAVSVTDENAGAVWGSLSAELSYISLVLQGAVEGKEIAPTAIESLRKTIGSRNP